MKRTYYVIISVVAACVIRALGAMLLSACSSQSPWVRVAHQMRALQGSAHDALPLALDPHTKRLIERCSTSSLRAIQAAEDALLSDEKWRQAKKKGYNLPELRDGATAALRDAELAQRDAVRDCDRAGIDPSIKYSAPDLRPPGISDGGMDGAPHVSTDAGTTPPPAHDAGGGRG